MRDVDILIFNCRQLLLILERVHCRITKQGNDGDKELGTHHVHFRIAVGHIHNATIVQLVICFEERNQHCVLTVLFLAVLIQLFQKVLIFMLGSSSVSLVLHLEHNGDKFSAFVVKLTEDEVTLTPGTSVVVFFKIGITESGGAQSVKLNGAVLLQSFANHFGRLLCLEVFIIINLLVFNFQLSFVAVLNGLLTNFAFFFVAFNLIGKLDKLFVLCGKLSFRFKNNLAHSKALFHFVSSKARFEGSNFFFLNSNRFANA